MPTQSLAFVAGRHLTYFRPGFYVRHLVPTGTGLKAWLFAAIKLCVPQFPVAPDLQGQVDRGDGARCSRTSRASQKEILASIVSKLLQSGGAIDLKKWVAAIDLTADRAGFLLAHDLQLATEVMRATEDGASVPGKERMKEIVLFQRQRGVLRAPPEARNRHRVASKTDRCRMQTTTVESPRMGMKWLSLSLLALAACSNNSGGNDAGSDGQTADGPSNGVNQTGQIVDFTSKNGIAGATVSSGSSSATADSTGKYTLSVPKDTAYTMTISADGYLTLHEQEWKLSGDADRGQTLAVANGIEAILKNALVPIPDPTLGVLSVNVEALSSCAAGPVGATITVPGMADADGGGGNVHVVYFSGGFPDGSKTAVTDTSTPSAVITNLPLGTFSQITVTHPTCTMSAFPIADPTIPTMTYTGNVEVAASGPMDDAGVTQNVASFMRVYLK